MTTVSTGFRLTPARRAWLERLRHDPCAQRPHGPAAFQCMAAGMTNWLHEVKATGETISYEDARRRWPNFEERHANVSRDTKGEALTEAGRRLLDEAPVPPERWPDTRDAELARLRAIVEAVRSICNQEGCDCPGAPQLKALLAELDGSENG